ncbi:hypothetical protein F503_02750 [Ophiostoma piceae UAMH 11346]|uniref:HNH nuclease domain-containing protein n=1 Tax=Ophiostoma piceae (strain UAMH 11346) TaxID=1262450 RepID=S3C1K8_OPHP1|nr:hypothetical protein F503_02750 [Ophiostoma piceae UAMH 11346]
MNAADSAQVARKRSEVDKCLLRDNNQCILTHTLNPEVCHIVPFATNSNQDRVRHIRATIPVLKCIIGNDYKLLTSNRGCSDCEWKMLSLNSQLHAWWARGMFAFKCLGVAPALDGSHGATVVLQFYWMPVQKEKARSAAWVRAVSDTDWRAFVETWETTWDHSSYGSVAGTVTVAGDQPPPPGVVATPVAKTGLLVQTGHVVEISISTMQNGLNMKAMIDVQWACVCLANMSGAAGDPDFLRDPYDDDDYNMDVADPVGEDFVVQDRSQG